MPVKKLIQFLDDNHISYEKQKHAKVYTAQEIAEKTHTPAKEFAKTVIVRIDGALAMVVLPAHVKVNLAQIKKISGNQQVALASEDEFEQNFPGCERGAMPPFGNLFDMPVYVDRALTKSQHIVFNAGSHAEVVKMAYKDYEKLVKPKVEDLG